MRRCTLQNIADRAEVHVTTVSMALRNHPSLPAATCARLKALAVEMGYVPDPMLTALSAYRRAGSAVKEPPVLGYLTNWQGRETWRDSYAHHGFFLGVQARATELGYRLEHFWLREPGMNSRRWVQVLTARGIDGLIVGAPPWGRAHLRLDWARFCAVKVCHSLVSPRLHYASNNQFQCIQMAMRKVRSYGYQRIGLALKAQHDECVDHQWLAGYLVEQQRLKASLRIPALTTRNWTPEVFAQWFGQHRPEVVLTVSLRVLQWLAAMGLHVPEDIGFVDLDCGDTTGGRAGVSQQHRAVGAAVIDKLVGLLQRNERGIPALPQMTLLDGKWLDGNSLPNLKRARTPTPELDLIQNQAA